MACLTLVFVFSLIASLPTVHSTSSTTAQVLLPSATFSDYSWQVTVPLDWNFTTILDVTNLSLIVSNSSIVENYSDALLDNITNPYPPQNSVPSVFVNGTFDVYATNSLNYALQQDLNTSYYAYSDETWALPVVCEWPISGMYSRLQRFLFYVLLVFALVWRHHEWLIAGALAYATTYSGAAAVQAWVSQK